MRQTANLPRNLVARRRAKELKRQYKRDQLSKVPKVKGMATAGGFWSAHRWTGLKPKKLEGFMLYVRGHKMTEEIWKKLYPEAPYGGRMRMR